MMRERRGERGCEERIQEEERENDSKGEELWREDSIGEDRRLFPETFILTTV